MPLSECARRLFAWFSTRGKQLKRSLKTTDKELARRRLGEMRQTASRLHGSEDRNLRLEELVKFWLESIVRSESFDAQTTPTLYQPTNAVL